LRRAPLGFWILGIVLVVYVAACTGQRENVWGADAWEHHRAVLSLTRQLRKPGNPTYASDLPSVRYSPYAVGWALVCRATKLDPYDALSAAAVLNTALLIVGLWLLLGAFDERASAAAVLLVMIALWGGPPGFANSYALADLPWHQVNPSAFSFALTLIGWSIFRNLATRGWCIGGYTLLILLATIAMLDHPMTGAFGIMGLFVLSITADPQVRRRMLLAASALTICVGLLCLAWPWYGFLAAVRTHQDTEYWFNRGVLAATLTQWCAPAMLCALFTIPLHHRPLVRTSLIGGAAALAAGLGSIVIHSPVFARFPLPGMIYYHLAIGIFAHQAGIFRPSTWLARIRSLTGPMGQAAYPILQVVVALLSLYFLIPQLVLAATASHLGRVYFARVFHIRDLQQHPRQTMAQLLEPVGTKDVVISDPQTSWLIPSFHGRVVAAMHFELFIPNQPQRLEAIEQFFSSDATEQEREQILRKYNVQWIVLDRGMISDQTYHALLRDSAVVNRAGDMVLMSTPRWIVAGS
jgi:hypothetical protein